MKWYRGNFEIFRYIADETPPTKVFKLENFDVDVSILRYQQVYKIVLIRIISGFTIRWKDLVSEEC